jgi:hypothetical protein
MSNRKERPIYVSIEIMIEDCSELAEGIDDRTAEYLERLSEPISEAMNALADQHPGLRQTSITSRVTRARQQRRIRRQLDY